MWKRLLTTIYIITEIARIKMENDWEIPFNQRRSNKYAKRLDEVLKQYSVVKVADANGAHHGEDYEEMKQVILDLLTGE
jgi:5-methylcytosine-specific restriction endonuclease McrBC regulatory subunit McrC